MNCLPCGRRANSNAAPPHRRPIPRVVVVDGRADDYSAWQSAASAGHVQLDVVATAHDALRLLQSNPPDLWVVNAELADLSGFDLCAMLKERTPRTPIYLVVDGYSVACERAAWQAQATMFVAKPGHHILLEHWLKKFAPSPAPADSAQSRANTAHRFAAKPLLTNRFSANQFGSNRFSARPTAGSNRQDGLTS